MHEDEDVALNAKAIALAVGGAALAGLLLVLARRDESQEPVARAEEAFKDAGKEAKKAARAAKKRRHELASAASDAGGRLAYEIQDKAAIAGVDARVAERDLKAAAWDAEQEAREAEHRLRAAGNRVVGDAAQLASRVGSEARTLAGEGRERIAQLRHRDDAESVAEREIARLHAEIDDLRQQLGREGKRARRDLSGIAGRFAGKGYPVPEGMASEATAAALAQLERSLKAKAPALLAAKNRGQVLEIIQQELGPTLKETAVQAATAALARWESARNLAESAESEVRERAKGADEEIREAAHKARAAAQAAADDARARADEAAHAAQSNGKHRFWRHRDEAEHVVSDARDSAEAAAEDAAQAAGVTDEEHRGKAGLFWGGAGLGLALYALLDAERRDQVLRLANEASIQVQELVRDLQGYDDEF